MEGQDFVVSQFSSVKESGFFPILYPVLRDNNNVDLTVFKGIPSGTQMRMYTILMDGKAVRQDRKTTPKYKAGATLTITDEFFGDEFLIPWTISQGMAVADKAVLRDISKEELQKQGFC